MRTLVENVKFEKGKWYAIRPDLEGSQWFFFTPKRAVKFDTVLKNICKDLKDTQFHVETAVSVAFTSRGTTCWTSNPRHAPIPDGVAVTASYVIHIAIALEGKNNFRAYAERM